MVWWMSCCRCVRCLSSCWLGAPADGVLAGYFSCRCCPSPGGRGGDRMVRSLRCFLHKCTQHTGQMYTAHWNKCNSTLDKCTQHTGQMYTAHGTNVHSTLDKCTQHTGNQVSPKLREIEAKRTIALNFTGSNREQRKLFRSLGSIGIDLFSKDRSAEAVFCYTAENSHNLKAQVT
jgi:hypothetical protein